MIPADCSHIEKLALLFYAYTVGVYEGHSPTCMQEAYAGFRLSHTGIITYFVQSTTTLQVPQSGSAIISNTFGASLNGTT